MKKVFLFLLPLLLIASEKPSVEQLFNVQTVKAKKITTTFKKRFYGLLKADESLVADVVPRFGGYVVKLYADTTYMKVKKGQVLAKVYSPEVFKAKEEYLNSLNYALRRGNSKMVESAKRKLQLLGVGKDEIAAVKARKKSDPYTLIRSPANGYLFEKHINEGGAFKAKSPLFRIVGLSNIWIEAKVSEPDIPALYKGVSFLVKARAVHGRFEAANPLLYPKIDPKSALATFRLDIKNKDARLLPGMFATLFVESEKESMLMLPRTAVIRKMGSWYVFKAGEFEGEYEPVEVSVKPIDNERYAILSGLNEGDEVVNNALFMIDSDAQINGLF
ncbi:MAG: efflux RND transporter periplasmic adaptor subunit [Hydrogenimonas sp.]|nr:efflux RND transporter periplasmic adaptor subunit [Hydrogenimonas sp.]